MRPLKVDIEERPSLEEINVRVLCPCVDDRVRTIVATVSALDRKLIGELGDNTHIVPASDVLYVESVDGCTFLYTADAVLESPLRLYEVEEALAGTEFVRASKSLLVNFDAVEALRPFANARLELILKNGEHQIASRQYAPEIKKKIGL